MGRRRLATWRLSAGGGRGEERKCRRGRDRGEEGAEGVVRAEGSSAMKRFSRSSRRKDTCSEGAA